MPFLEPETTLAATIATVAEESIVRAKTMHPEARMGPSTTFQSLTRRLNDLHGFLIHDLVILNKASLRMTRQRWNSSL